jgi:flavin reductase (DIM6/NTAB) family NADH-FMN oxidoreductase RutF
VNTTQDITDPKALRQVWGTFPTGVAVVTTQTPQGIVGITINSFVSISVDPPLVAWSIDKASNRFDLFVKAKSYGISILGAEQKDLANRFVKADPYVRPDEAIMDGAHGLKLKACVGYMACHLYRDIELGDHIMLVGRVEAFERSEGASLTYYRGQYGIAE